MSMKCALHPAQSNITSLPPLRSYHLILQKIKNVPNNLTSNNLKKEHEKIAKVTKGRENKKAFTSYNDTSPRVQSYPLPSSPSSALFLVSCTPYCPFITNVQHLKARN